MTYKYVVNFTGQARESDKLPLERFDQLWFINQYNYGSLGYYNLLTRGAFRFLGWEYHCVPPRHVGSCACPECFRFNRTLGG